MGNKKKYVAATSVILWTHPNWFHWFYVFWAGDFVGRSSKTGFSTLKVGNDALASKFWGFFLLKNPSIVDDFPIMNVNDKRCCVAVASHKWSWPQAYQCFKLKESSTNIIFFLLILHKKSLHLTKLKKLRIVLLHELKKWEDLDSLKMLGEREFQS